MMKKRFYGDLHLRLGSPGMVMSRHADVLPGLISALVTQPPHRSARPRRRWYRLRPPPQEVGLRDVSL